MPVFDHIRDDLIQASGGTNVGTKWIPRKTRDGALNGENTNLAHVYPQNAMKGVIEDALNKWPNPTCPTIDHDAPARLLAFVDWIFKIDTQAVVNSDFHNAGGHGLRTPNEGINQRYLKNWADVADKICCRHT